MLATLCIALNGLLLGLAFTFFPWHGNGGGETARPDRSQDNSDAKKKNFIPM